VRFPDSVPRAGAPLVEAIARYAAEHGAPPETLGELAPIYIASIPDPGWGTRQWEYSRDAESPRYALAVRRGPRSHERCFYANSEEERRGWGYDSSPGELPPEGREKWRARSPFTGEGS